MPELGPLVPILAMEQQGQMGLMARTSVMEDGVEVEALENNKMRTLTQNVAVMEAMGRLEL